MRIEAVVRNKVPSINPLFFGYENNPTLKKRHPIVRNRIFVHYVKSGKGYFELNGSLYHLMPGEVFLITAGNNVTYWADKDDPWELIWVCFEGEICTDFQNLPHVFNDSGEIFEEIRKAIEANGRRDILVTHLILKWYYVYFPTAKNPREITSISPRSILKIIICSPSEYPKLQKQFILTGHICSGSLRRAWE